MEFKLGDRVAWTTRGGRGKETLRTGKVVQVVEAGRRPHQQWPVVEPGMHRSVVSYVVQSEGRCYWPRNGTLAPAMVDVVLL